MAFITRFVRTTGRYELLEVLDGSPLTRRDKELMIDVIEGASYKELAAKYALTTGGVYQWKRKVYENLHFYLVRKLNE